MKFDKDGYVKKMSPFICRLTGGHKYCSGGNAYKTIFLNTDANGDFTSLICHKCIKCGKWIANEVSFRV